MRRSEREIFDIDEKISILNKCKVCRIGLSENNIPYIVPLNYGYVSDNNKITLYFHSALEGKKIDVIKNNNKACFEIDCDTGLIEGEDACNYGYSYKSIIGFGEIIILENNEEKIYGLNRIMKHQTEKNVHYNFSDEQIKNVCVYKLTVEKYTGKQKEFPKK